MSDWQANSGTSLKNEDHEASIPKTTGPMNAGDAHAHEIDTGPNVVPDSGVLKTPESGIGNFSIASDAGEQATPTHGTGVHGFEPSSIPQVASGGTVGSLGDSFHFKDEISGSKGPGVIDVAGLNDIPASMSNHGDAAGTHGPLAISDGAQAIELPNSSVKLQMGLTRREQQLVPMIGRGLTNKEIANQLNLSEQTIKNHVHRILHKIGVENRLAILTAVHTHEISN